MRLFRSLGARVVSDSREKTKRPRTFDLEDGFFFLYIHVVVFGLFNFKPTREIWPHADFFSSTFFDAINFMTDSTFEKNSIIREFAEMHEADPPNFGEEDCGKKEIVSRFDVGSLTPRCLGASVGSSGLINTRVYTF